MERDHKRGTASGLTDKDRKQGPPSAFKDEKVNQSLSLNFNNQSDHLADRKNGPIRRRGK